MMQNPLYLNKTPKQILSSMDVQADLDMPKNDFYEEFIMEWMADLYVYMQWKHNLESYRIVENVKPKELYVKYYPIHETSVENGVEKLIKWYIV